MSPTPDFYTLSLHDALPILSFAKCSWMSPRYHGWRVLCRLSALPPNHSPNGTARQRLQTARSEEHTSELQSPMYLVCRLLLEKKNTVARSKMTKMIYTTKK